MWKLSINLLLRISIISIVATAIIAATEVIKDRIKRFFQRFKPATA